MFDDSLQQGWQTRDGVWVFDMPSGWMQGRSVFGGLTAAVGVALGRRQMGSSWALRTMNIHLVRPTVAGPTEGRVRVVREGKSVAFMQVNLLQDEQEVALLTLTFASARVEAMQVEASPRWQGPGPEALVELPYIPGLMPEFLQHMSLRWASGGPPFCGADAARYTGYCRFNTPVAGVAAVIGLLDAWPCPSLSLLSSPAPASTVSWTAHILRVPDDFDDWFAFSYETVVAEDGFHTVVGRLHGPDGRLVGWTEQLAVVFD